MGAIEFIIQEIFFYIKMQAVFIKGGHMGGLFAHNEPAFFAPWGLAKARWTRTKAGSGDGDVIPKANFASFEGDTAKSVSAKPWLARKTTSPPGGSKVCT